VSLRISRAKLYLCSGLLLAGAALLTSCSRSSAGSKSAQAGAEQAVPVMVASAVQKAAPIEVRAIGTVEAYTTVSIKSQISGQVQRVHFREGQDVKPGDLLFTIDPRPFESALKQTEATLARDTARAKEAEANVARDIAQGQNAELDALRYAELVKEGVVSKEQAERVRTTAAALAAAVEASKAAVESARSAIEADRAAVQSAKVQLSFCYIRAPMSGRTGNLIIHEGNVVKANENPALVVINQLTPIYVNFSVPEQYLAEIKKRMASGKLKVDAAPQNAPQPAAGVLTFIDNAVDSTTGTIRLKATFANQDRRLWPGQFANVVLILGQQQDAVMVPTPAVQSGQTGPFIFVVKPDLTVESRPVKPGRSFGGETVVEQGIRPGERVVTDGQLRLVPGARIEIKSKL